jgi:glycerophosphoryl diester phosphodiesterase
MDLPATARRPAVIAHRGASGEAPENTLAAFRRAMELGVDAVELDVQLSADGEPVVIHDDLLDRTTDGRGLVAAQPLAALQRLDAGRWFDERFAGERIPTLAEALVLLRPTRVIVEIKNRPIVHPGIASRVAGVVREVGHPAVTISSFDHPLLLEVRKAAPGIPTAVLFFARPVDPVRLARDAAATILHPHWIFLTRDMIEGVRAVGLRVETWVVDDAEHMVRLAAMGVDGIMSNYPDRLITVLTGTDVSADPSVNAGWPPSRRTHG